MIEQYRISTSFPVIENPSYLVNGGHTEQGLIMLNRKEIVKCCPALKDAHKLLLKSDPIGRVGNYCGVYELSVGAEAYTPDTGSNPGEGVIGVEEIMRVIFFNTYCNVEATSYKDVVTFIDKLAYVHPWEHPVIKLYYKGVMELYEGKV